MQALSRFWAHTPPAALALKRISLALGIATPRPSAPAAPASLDDTVRALVSAGIPLVAGRPDDPMLDLL